MQSFRAKALFAVAFMVAAGQFATGASSPILPAAAALCPASTASCSSEPADALQVSLPEGAEPCPASGIGAACLTNQAVTNVAPGTPSTPDGQTPCPAASASALSTPAACSDPLANAQATNNGAPASNPAVEPSVPVSTIRPAASSPKITLASSAAATLSGSRVVLTATAATTNVLSAGNALEIFDTTTETLIGSCSQGSQCTVAYSSSVGVHQFQAFLAPPSEAVPGKGSVSSNELAVGWVSVSLTTDQRVVGPGKSAILTAASTVPVEQFGYAIQLIDVKNATPITYCSRGTNCSVAVNDSASGTRSFAAVVGPANSAQVSVTWLSVALTGTSTYRLGSTVHLEATANVDLTDTPWSLGILDQQGRLVGPPCKNGSSCRADVPVTAAAGEPQFTAVVGAVPPARTEGKVVQLVQKVEGPTNLVNIQVRSAAVHPARLLWGVDSCKAFTGDPTGEIYPGVVSGLGTPDFWGRYLTTTVCPAISSAEVATAQSHHMAILPIYNNYDCSAVAGYDTGRGYAQAAVAAAQNLQIPQGRVLAIDIEPPGPYCSGNVDAAFVRGWYDAVTAAGYVPVYYGNGTSGSEFGNAYCAAQSQENEISQNSFIWSFEPSLDSGGWSKVNPPGWAPNETGCPDNVAAWQYQIDVYSPNPNIDSDEALATLPLWYP